MRRNDELQSGTVFREPQLAPKLFNSETTLSEIINPPSSIGIIGAGPIGLEAALYGRYLGYDVTVFEKESVAHRIVAQGDTELDKPYEFNVTSLGLQALRAQIRDFSPLPTGTVITAAQWLEHYLLPVSQSDLLRGRVKTECEILSIESIEPIDESNESEEEASLDDDEVFDPDEITPNRFKLLGKSEAGDVAEEFATILVATGTESTLGLPEVPTDGIYQLGIKAAEAPSQYTMPHGYAQIRALYSKFGGRPTLDLYGTAPG